MQAPVSNQSIAPESFALSADRKPVENERALVGRAPEPEPQQRAGTLGGFARMIARQFRTILLVILVSLIVAALKIQSISPLYTTSAQIMIQRITASNAQSASDRQRFLQNEQELLVSTPVLASALGSPDVRNLSTVHAAPDALKRIKQQLHVDSGNGDDLINISYDCADPRDGTRLLTAVVDSYVRFRSGIRESTIEGSSTAIRLEKGKALDALAQKRTQLQQFSVQHGIASGNEEVDVADAELHELGLKLAQAHVATVAAQGAYDQMQHELADDPRMKDRLTNFGDNDSSLAGGDEEAIAKQISVLQMQLAGFGTKFMANYEPVQLLHRKIDDLKLTRDAIIQQRWQAAVRSESELRASFVLEEKVAATSVANQQIFEQRKADVLEAQKQVAVFDRQLKNLESANKLITTMVTVIEPPTASDKPTTPRSSEILLIGGLAGLCLGCGLAGIRDLQSETPPASTATTLGAGLPILARLPAVPRRQLAMNSWRDRVVDSAAEFAEACLRLQAAIESVVSFSGAKTVLITSADAREGKSTLASLLALTLAQTGKRVLLVDANLHAPVQGDIFDIESTYGLGELLEEEIESSFVSYVHPGSDPRMDILLSGTATVESADLFNSPRFTNLMAAIATEYDVVLIDSACLAAGSDAQIIASACDATIILARESSLSRKTLSKTRDGLTSVGGNVIGVVVNCGMPAHRPQEAIAKADVPALAPPPSAPMQVTTVRLDAPVDDSPVDDSLGEPAPSVVTAQVRRATDPAPDLTEPRDAEEGYGWLWSYVLGSILLLGAWMILHGNWGAPATPAGIARMHAAARISNPAPATPVQEEPVAILMAGAALVVITVIAGLHARPPRQDVALVLLSTVLAIASILSGSINALSGMPKNLGFSCATEVALLFLSLTFGWQLVRRLSAKDAIVDTETRSASDIVLAVFAGSCIMSALMILLSQWQTKGECLAVIAFSSCLAAMVAYWMAKPRWSVCLWLSPLIVALFGYTCAILNTHGIHMGMLLSLARPVALDYASMGSIGAMLGFWIAKSMGRMVWTSLAMAE
jgi:capsular exopolysaccharide synthesis family protein